TIKAPLAPSVSSAMVRLHADGSATLLTATVEIGQGARTTLSQIVAQELALPLDRVRIARPEIGMSPYDQATSASRSTTLMGLAVMRAARDVRDQLLAIGARQLGGDATAMTLHDGSIVAPAGRRRYAEALAAHFGTGGELIGRGTYRRESGLIPTAPAVANAIARAIGVRMTDLPMTPERVWRAIRARASRSL